MTSSIPKIRLYLPNPELVLLTKVLQFTSERNKCSYKAEAHIPVEGQCTEGFDAFCPKRSAWPMRISYASNTGVQQWHFKTLLSTLTQRINRFESLSEIKSKST